MGLFAGFEWDPHKAQSNRRKHDVSFDEAAECFADSLAMVLTDHRHPDRLILIGQSMACRLVFTVYFTRPEVVKALTSWLQLDGVAGLAAIRPRYVSLFEAFTPQIELRVDEVCAAGGLAFVRGRNRGRLVARAGGASRELDDVFVMLLRRGAAGAFRISHLIWHRASGGPAAIK
jgi:hypothetical protein